MYTGLETAHTISNLCLRRYANPSMEVSQIYIMREKIFGSFNVNYDVKRNGK